MKKVLLFICLSLPVGLACRAQDPTFSQYYNNPLYFNPAFTGIDEGLTIYQNDRSEWPRIPSQFNTQSISADLQNLCISSGFGIMLLNDNEGEGRLRTVMAGLSYAYRIVLVPGQAILQAGAQVSFNQKSINWNNLEFDDQFDALNGLVRPTANVPPNSSSVSYPDFNVGAVLRYNWRRKRSNRLRGTLVVAGSASHVTEPNQSLFALESNLPVKYVFQTTLYIPTKHVNQKQNELYIAPNFQYELQSQFTTIQAGVRVSRLPISAGLAFRTMISNLGNSDALVINLGINGNFSDNVAYRIGYSYDLTVSKLKDSTLGSHELSLILVFPKLSPICQSITGTPGNKRKMDCPNF